MRLFNLTLTFFLLYTFSAFSADQGPVIGCTDPEACNFNPEATVDDGSCIFIDAFILTWDGPTEFCISDGESDLFAPGIVNEGNSGQNSAFVLTDDSGIILYAGGTFFVEFEGTEPGICNAYSVNYQDGIIGLAEGLNLADLVGCFDISDPITLTKIEGACTDPLACNYDAEALCDGGLCEYACPGYDCLGDCLDINTNEICDNDEILGCTDPSALNYYPVFSVDDGSCIYAESTICGEGTVWSESDQECIILCQADLNQDGLVSTADLLEFLTFFGQSCP